MRPLPDGVIAPGTDGTRSWTAAAAAGLVLAVATASAPSLLPVVILGGVLALALGRRRTRTLWWTLLPILALQLPYALSTLQDPRGLLGDPGVPTPFDPAAPWQQLLGFPVSFDPFLPPAAAGFLGAGPWALVAAVIIGGPVLALAARALFVPHGRGRMVRSFWLVAVLALALAAVVPLVPVAVGTSALIQVFPGPLVSAVSLCLLAAALSGSPGPQHASSAAAPPHRRLFRVAGGLVLAAGPLVGLGLWLSPEVVVPPAASAGPVVIPGDRVDEAADAPATTDLGTGIALRPVAERPLPATAADRGAGPEQIRTLVITVDDEDDVAAALMRGSGTTLDDLNPLYAARVLGPGSAVLDDSESARTLRSTAAVIVGATGADPRADLRDLGVAFVVLRQSETAGGVPQQPHRLRPRPHRGR
ncbi:hypothetical protein MN0502_09700 [Arthrobacter sp. MN05-02]|nr:hypothetical protein MN0502_09700 [Arthrobacter sp. MN05-02]